MSNLFDRLGGEEDRFFSSQFLSPVIRGRPIRVRIAGIVVTLPVAEPTGFHGWGVFRPRSYRAACLVRSPTLTERQAYLSLFPVLRLILCLRQGEQWLGIPASQADTRFRVAGLVPVQLAEEAQLFEVVRTRFDGAACWFEGVDPAHSPRAAVYLRESLAALRDPDLLALAGLTQEEKDAYRLFLEADSAARKDRQEEKIKAALRKAGAAYRGHVERGDTYTIEYVVGGETHRSVVDKETLGIQSAGICLSGGDSSFDLQSLVGVIREGMRRRRIVRVGTNYGDHQYGPVEDQDEW